MRLIQGGWGQIDQMKVIMTPAEAQPVSITAVVDNNHTSMQQESQAPLQKKIRRFETAAHLCQYGQQGGFAGGGRRAVSQSVSPSVRQSVSQTRNVTANEQAQL